jgi:Protein of unknown function (DUF3619)
MNGDEREKLFLEHIRKELDAGTENLDHDVLLRLRKVRQVTLEEAEKRAGRRFFIPKWVTAGGIATAMMMVVAVSFWYKSAPEGIPVRQAEDVEILTAQENLDISRDLDFYRWLAAANNGS